MTGSLLRLKAVRQLTGLSTATIYRKLDPRSPYFDEKFPRPVRIGTRCIAWAEDELAAWIDGCMKAGRGAAAAESPANRTCEGRTHE